MENLAQSWEEEAKDISRLATVFRNPEVKGELTGWAKGLQLAAKDLREAAAMAAPKPAPPTHAQPLGLWQAGLIRDTMYQDPDGRALVRGILDRKTATKP